MFTVEVHDHAVRMRPVRHTVAHIASGRIEVGNLRGPYHAHIVRPLGLVELGEREDVGHQGRQASRLAVDARRKSLYVFLQYDTVAQQLGSAHDRCDGRLELVRHVRRKLGAHRSRVADLVHLLHQLLLLFLEVRDERLELTVRGPLVGVRGVDLEDGLHEPTRDTGRHDPAQNHDTHQDDQHRRD